MAKGSIDQAIKNFNQAISINPRYAEAYYQMGLAFVHKKIKESALQYLTKAKSLDSNLSKKVDENIQKL